MSTVKYYFTIDKTTFKIYMVITNTMRLRENNLNEGLSPNTKRSLNCMITDCKNI